MHGMLVNIEVSSIANILFPLFFNIDNIIADTFEMKYH